MSGDLDRLASTVREAPDDCDLTLCTLDRLHVLGALCLQERLGQRRGQLRSDRVGAVNAPQRFHRRWRRSGARLARGRWRLLGWFLAFTAEQQPGGSGEKQQHRGAVQSDTDPNTSWHPCLSLLDVKNQNTTERLELPVTLM